MQSPFKIFRRHQKVVLAGLVLMAMLAFGLGDVVMRMGRTRIGGTASQTVVETNIGNLTQLELNNLRQKRRIVQQFIVLAYRESHPEFEKYPQLVERIALGRYGFGGDSPQDLVYNWIYRHEAAKMGIVVSDEQVEAYIRQVTDRKLSRKKFFELLQPMQLGPKELYDMFREELQALLAYRAKVPGELPSPEKYWDYYQQLNTRETIVAAALPIASFAAKVGEPTEAQINSLFEKHRSDNETAFEGEFKPGFRQPRKVDIQYVKLNYAAIEKQVRDAGPIGDKEVEEYYEANKNFDRNLWLTGPAAGDESAPIEPDIAPERPAPPALPETEAEADNQENSKQQPEAAPTEEKQVDCGAGGNTLGVDDPKNEAAGDATKGDGTDRAAGDQDKDDKEPEPKQPRSQAQESEQGDVATGDAEKLEAGGSAISPGSASPGPTGQKSPGANIRYKPLDDDLRDQIRETIVGQKAKKLMKEMSDKAKEAIVDVGLRFSGEMKLVSPTPEQSATLVRRSEEELRKIADAFGMTFGQTGLVSRVEMSEQPGIGRAVESGAGESFLGEATVADLAFSGSTNLCRTFKAEELSSSDIYIGWKVQDVAAHVPQLDDPGIREQVVAAWKRLEALPVARKRAAELAEAARKSGKGLKDALADQTVTGDPAGPTVDVSPESPEFSYWRESTAPDPSGRRPPVQLGAPIGVNNPGRNFMRVVFDELGEGDIGVTLNQDASVCYVVQVVSRRPADRDAFKNAPLFGPSSPYGFLAQADRQLVKIEFDRRVEEKYAVKWREAASEDMSAPYEEE